MEVLFFGYSYLELLMPPSHQTSSQNVLPRPKRIVKRAVVGVERVT